MNNDYIDKIAKFKGMSWIIGKYNEFQYVLTPLGLSMMGAKPRFGYVVFDKLIENGEIEIV